jgi:thymidylate synthase
MSPTRGKVFSALGELCWYLSGTADADFVSYYVGPQPYSKNLLTDTNSISGAYGPRLFGNNGQFHVVADLLRNRPDSKRAVIHLGSPRDVRDGVAQPPCTCTLQFLVRESAVNLIVYMRSNDAHTGLPHDLFAFTMLQEIMARSLGLDIGEYTHMVGSLHMYEGDQESANLYVQEGWYARDPMPPMPIGDPWEQIQGLLNEERELREGDALSDAEHPAAGYWADLAALLRIFALTHRSVPSRQANIGKVEAIQSALSTRSFNGLIRDRIQKISE